MINPTPITGTTSLGPSCFTLDCECAHCRCCDRDEVNEAVRLEVVRALGLWAACLDALPGCLLDRFVAGLKEKESLQKGHLQALLQVQSALPKL